MWGDDPRLLAALGQAEGRQMLVMQQSKGGRRRPSRFSVATWTVGKLAAWHAFRTSNQPPSS